MLCQVAHACLLLKVLVQHKVMRQVHRSEMQDMHLQLNAARNVAMSRSNTRNVHQCLWKASLSSSLHEVDYAHKEGDLILQDLLLGAELLALLGLCACRIGLVLHTRTSSLIRVFSHNFSAAWGRVPKSSAELLSPVAFTRVAG